MSGLLPRLIVGTMNFGTATTESEADRIVGAALEHGLNAFDTANAYAGGESERMLGRALRGRRRQALIASKVGFRGYERSAEGLSRTTILRSIDETLTNLRTDYLDLYYLHVPDDRTPIEETVRAIGQLISEGKIHAWGLSNHASWQILMVDTACVRLGVPVPAVSQVVYNFVMRQIEVEYLRFARIRKIETAVYSPLAGGLLAEHQRDRSIPAPGSRFDMNERYRRRYWSTHFLMVRDELSRIAAAEGVSISELSYAWLRRQPGVDSIVVGPRTSEHLHTAIRAVDVALSASTLSTIEDLKRSVDGTDLKYAR